MAYNLGKFYFMLYFVKIFHIFRQYTPRDVFLTERKFSNEILEKTQKILRVVG